MFHTKGSQYNYTMSFSDSSQTPHPPCHSNPTRNRKNRPYPYSQNDHHNNAPTNPRYNNYQRYNHNQRNPSYSKKNIQFKSERDDTYRGNDRYKSFSTYQKFTDNPSTFKQSLNEEGCDLNYTTCSNAVNLLKSKSGWYEVFLKHAHQYTSWEYVKDYIIKYVWPIEFRYYKRRYQEEKDQIAFYICDFELAQKLYNSKCAIRVDSNLRIKFWVQSTIPTYDITDSMTTIGAVIAKRYDPDRNHLDLSRLHDDSDLLEADCFLPLDRPCAVKYVFTIVSSSLPDLKSINLNNNRLFHRDSLRIVANSTPQLKTLNLKNNQIKELKDLEGLQSLNLEELHLAGNEVVEITNDYEEIKIEIMKLFPKLINLDGNDIDRKEQKFVPLPPIQPSCMCSENAKLFAKEFIGNYFELFDATSRQSLESFYHKNAQFSLVVLDSHGKNKTICSLIKSSRNLIRVKHENQQEQLLFRGRTNIINFLNKLPALRHDPSSLTCDCPIMSGVIHLSISGLYEVLNPLFLKGGKHLVADSKTQSLLAFSRAFVFIPDGTGKFLISNDQLFLTNASTSMYIKAFASLNGLEMSFDLEDDKKKCALSAQQHLNLIKKLSLATGVSLSTSEAYLKNWDWNYESALENIQTGYQK